MTFDQCPECNQPVSSNKRTCNHCGYPLKGELIPFLYHNMRFSFILFSLVVITIETVSFRFSPEYDAFII
ncbi:zinc-ribbon domain-containing protein [Entomomonas moraniae]|uniref:zinc-ribbon domain-containing protein n=1 Tax=Entomomonas moraniae TaxID=2213226 RepID=UPI0038993905